MKSITFCRLESWYVTNDIMVLGFVVELIDLALDKNLFLSPASDLPRVATTGIIG